MRIPYNATRQRGPAGSVHRHDPRGNSPRVVHQAGMPGNSGVPAYSVHQAGQGQRVSLPTATYQVKLPCRSPAGLPNFVKSGVRQPPRPTICPPPPPALYSRAGCREPLTGVSLPPTGWGYGQHGGRRAGPTDHRSLVSGAMAGPREIPLNPFKTSIVLVYSGG